MRKGQGDGEVSRMKLVVSLLLVTLAFALQLPIPPFEGDGNPQHDGQPKWCQSHDDSHVHNCDCRKMECDPNGMPGGGEHANCKVYCRPKACRCVKPCMTRVE
jgi:hypothetical protein